MRLLYTYFPLKLRELFRSNIYRGFGLFLLVLVLTMAALLPRVSSDSAYTLAVLNDGDTQLGRGVIAALEADGGYRLRLCTSRRELEAAVLSGEVLCGYAFTKEADQRVARGSYTRLVEGLYREKSPAAALCDEAVCGAIFGGLAPGVAERALSQSFPEAAQGDFGERYARAAANSSPMEIILLGGDGQILQQDNGGMITGFLYNLLGALVIVFAIITAFYTKSIDKSLVSAGNSPLLVEFCAFLSYTVSYLALLVAAHLVTAAFLPQLLAEGRLLGQLVATALAGGVLQSLSRRFLSPAVIPLLPFAAVLLVAVTSLY